MPLEPTVVPDEATKGLLHTQEAEAVVEGVVVGHGLILQAPGAGGDVRGTAGLCAERQGAHDDLA